MTIKALVRRDTRIFFRFKSQLLRYQFISRRKLPIPPLPHPSSPPPQCRLYRANSMSNYFILYPIRNFRCWDRCLRAIFHTRPVTRRFRTMVRTMVRDRRARFLPVLRSQTAPMWQLPRDSEQSKDSEQKMAELGGERELDRTFSRRFFFFLPNS